MPDRRPILDAAWAVYLAQRTEERLAVLRQRAKTLNRLEQLRAALEGETVKTLALHS
jgi:hypothetical protein